jgi:hypothetical protein
MNFEELLKYCTEINESTNEKCLVCHIPLNNDEKYIKLGCSHIFHQTCIKHKSLFIKCLYCEKVSKPNILNYSNNPSKQVDTICCKFIIKTGINKGKYCDRLNCNYHKIESNKIQFIGIKPMKKPKQKIINGCQTIIKSGPRSGQLCQRINCSYHKEKSVKQKQEKPIKQKQVKEITSMTFQDILTNNFPQEDVLIEV